MRRRKLIGNYMWKPAAEAHAIERVALTFFFTDPLPLKLIEASVVHVDAMLGGAFSKKQKMMAANLSVNLDQQGASNRVIQESTPSGFGYFVGEADQEEAVRFSPEICFFASSSYGTWAGFRDEAASVLMPFLELVLRATDVKTIKLEYSDRFVFHGNPKEADVREIIDLPAIHLPDTAIGKGFPWHSRRGWFIDADHGPDLINLDVTEALVTHRDRPDEPLVSIHVSTVIERRLTAPLADIEVLKKIVEELHLQSKSVTKDVLTKNSTTLIGLN